MSWAKPTPTACSRDPALVFPGGPPEVCPVARLAFVLRLLCPRVFVCPVPWASPWALGILCTHPGSHSYNPGGWASRLQLTVPGSPDPGGTSSHIQTSCLSHPSSPLQWRPHGHSTDSCCLPGGNTFGGSCIASGDFHFLTGSLILGDDEAEVDYVWRGRECVFQSQIRLHREWSPPPSPQCYHVWSGGPSRVLTCYSVRWCFHNVSAVPYQELWPSSDNWSKALLRPQCWKLRTQPSRKSLGFSPAPDPDMLSSLRI